MAPNRLSALDASFLDVETASAHHQSERHARDEQPGQINGLARERAIVSRRSVTQVGLLLVARFNGAPQLFHLLRVPLVSGAAQTIDGNVQQRACRRLQKRLGS